MPLIIVSSAMYFLQCIRLKGPQISIIHLTQSSSPFCCFHCQPTPAMLQFKSYASNRRLQRASSRGLLSAPNPVSIIFHCHLHCSGYSVQRSDAICHPTHRLVHRHHCSPVEPSCYHGYHDCPHFSWYANFRSPRCFFDLAGIGRHAM